jgi:Uma2 family endonuclease
MVVEILSPSGHQRDRGVKSARYAACGVPHYWIVDPEARILECHRLEGGTYRRVVRSAGDGRALHPDWPEMGLDLAELWM